MAVTDREITASETHLEFEPTLWADDTRDAIEFEEVLTKLVNTQYESTMRIGRTLNIPLRGNFNTQTLTEGVSNSINFQAGAQADSTADALQSITVSTYEYAAALISAVVTVQSKYDERQRVTHALGYALMRGVEVSIAALPASFSQIVGSYGVDPDFDILRRAWQYERDAGVTEGCNWWFGPAAVSGLFGIDKLTSSDFVSGKSAVESARLPTTLLGYPAYISNLLNAPAAGQTDCFLGHREAIILIRQIKPTVKTDYLIRQNADGIIAYDFYTVAEANWVAEAPVADADPSAVDVGGVLIRSS